MDEFQHRIAEQIRGNVGTGGTYPTFLKNRRSNTKGKHPLPGRENLATAIEKLSASEKAELLDAVWESLEADALSSTDAQRAELDHRIERHEQNPSDVIPWEQVRASLFKKP
jgi:putative addiction module component (TIGR02574 family)